MPLQHLATIALSLVSFLQRTQLVASLSLAFARSVFWNPATFSFLFVPASCAFSQAVCFHLVSAYWYYFSWFRLVSFAVVLFAVFECLHTASSVASFHPSDVEYGLQEHEMARLLRPQVGDLNSIGCGQKHPISCGLVFPRLHLPCELPHHHVVVWHPAHLIFRAHHWQHRLGRYLAQLELVLRQITCQASWRVCTRKSSPCSLPLTKTETSELCYYSAPAHYCPDLLSHQEDPLSATKVTLAILSVPQASDLRSLKLPSSRKFTANAALCG